MALRSGQNPLWQALGVLYLGLPALALVSLRLSPPRGALVIIGLFLIVWATDTGALIFGNLIGGPRLAPVLSPSKTWAGTIGGSVTAAIVFGLLHPGFWAERCGSRLCSRWPSASPPMPAICSKVFVKRRFGIKDSGSLIPGHGGVLDRIEFDLWRPASALALLVFVFAFQSAVRGRVMKPIAATRIFDERPRWRM